jgi:chemotaxis signal transduction protein
MSEVQSRLAEQAVELRLAFDGAFAEAARQDATPMEDLLALRVGREPYALRLSEINGLFVDRKITRLPGGPAALLGFAGFRGAVAPAYDLQILLGRPAVQTLRWLVVASAAPVAFAFEAFEGHLRVPSSAITPRQAGEHSHRLIRDFVSIGGVARPIAHLPSALKAIQQLLGGPNKQEEG